MNTLPILLTTDEVAAYLGQKPRTIHDWIRAGLLPGVKIGRHWFIIEDDLRSYIERRSAWSLANQFGPGV